jgi:Tfp pilus assembly protein PilF
MEKEPDYARAWAGLADCYTVLGCWGYEPPHQSYPRAKAAAERALELDDSLSEAHVSLAIAKKDYYWDWAGSEQAYKRALELNPGNATARQWYAECLACLGRQAESIAECERARALDPLSLIVAATLGRHGYCFARQSDRGIAELREVVRNDPEFWVAHVFLGFAYMYTGQLPEALAEFRNAKQLNDNADVEAGIGYTLARLNQHAEARKVLAELKNLRRGRYVQPVIIALVHAALGENDEAFLWLEKAFEERAQWLSEIKVDPAFDSLRSDARLGQLLQRMGLA